MNKISCCDFSYIVWPFNGTVWMGFHKQMAPVQMRHVGDGWYEKKHWSIAVRSTEAANHIKSDLSELIWCSEHLNILLSISPLCSWDVFGWPLHAVKCSRHWWSVYWYIPVRLITWASLTWFHCQLNAACWWGQQRCMNRPLCTLIYSYSWLQMQTLFRLMSGNGAVDDLLYSCSRPRYDCSVLKYWGIEIKCLCVWSSINFQHHYGEGKRYWIDCIEPCVLLIHSGVIAAKSEDWSRAL